MKKISIVVLAVMLFASPALAQDVSGVNTRGFVFVAPGTYTGYDSETMLRFGGGIETVARNGLGFAFDAGWLTTTRGLENGITSVSGAMLYEFPLDRPVRPYLRGGAGLIANRSGSEAFWNIGGGINYWFRDRHGLKVEVRDTFTDSNMRYGLLEVLVGYMFKF